MGNFYLDNGSKAIDSSLNSLADRPSIAAVKSELGIPQSPILAPDRDRYGQLRIDDPLQDPPPGLGSNIFKDRGALERADFTMLTAALFDPEDNDALGFDLDADRTEVLIEKMLLTQIVVQLNDVGVGVDDYTVTASTVSITEDGVLLTEGVEYRFTYGTTNNTISLTLLTATGQTPRTYVVTLDNDPVIGIRDLAGNALQANQPDNSTQFTITTGGYRPQAGDENGQQSFTVLEDVETSVTLIGDDGDPRGDFPLTFVLTTLPGTASLSQTAGGSAITAANLPLSLDDPELFFLTALDDVSQQSFQFQVMNNADGKVSTAAVVTVDVTPVNDQPLANSSTISVLEDVRTTITLTGDPGGGADELVQSLTYVLTSLPATGTLSQTAGGPAITAADLGTSGLALNDPVCSSPQPKMISRSRRSSSRSRTMAAWPMAGWT